MIAHYKWRTSFLAATSIGIFFLTCYSWFSPTLGKRQASPVSFSEKIALNSWRLIKAEELTDRDRDLPNNANVLNTGKRYIYQKQGIPLTIEMRYLIGVKSGVKDFLVNRTDIPVEVIEKADEHNLKSLGSYLLFSDRSTAYLSTCINPLGNTTNTLEQFLSNRFIYDLQFSNLLLWLLGKHSLIDLRCIWVHMSIPIDGSNPETTYPTLTKVWINWHYWWNSRFPSL